MTGKFTVHIISTAKIKLLKSRNTRTESKKSDTRCFAIHKGNKKNSPELMPVALQVIC